MVVIKRIKAADTYSIRKRILRQSVSLSYKFNDDFDSDSLHFGLFYNEVLVGVVSAMKSDYNEFDGCQYQFRGMATELNFRNKGYGKLLILELEKHLIDIGVRFLWCNARVTAKNFYKKLSYEVVGEQFDVYQIGLHITMFKRLSV